MNTDKPAGFVKDVSFRAHVVELKPKPKATDDYHEPKLAEWALTFDSETTLDPQIQALLFLFYRVLHLGNGVYVCVEEGIAHADDLSAAELKIIHDYARSHRTEVVSSQYDEHLHVYSRTDFMEKVFFEAIKNRAFICGLNCSFDISRIMVDSKASHGRAWSYILSQREIDVEKLRKNWLTKKWKSTIRGNLRTNVGKYKVIIKHGEAGYNANVYTPEKERLSAEEWRPSIEAAKQDGLLILSGQIQKMKGSGHPVMEPNPERPRVIDTAKDSKASFFKLTKPLHPEEWPTYKEIRSGKESLRMIFRVLDLRTLAWALYNERHSLKSLCKFLQSKNQKQDHEPSGKVTIEDLDYCRQDVRCTVDALNALMAEFIKHPIDLHPDRAVSPASIGKAYMLQMGYVPPSKKFKDIPNFDYMCGIAAQAFSAGRAEVRIRNTAVPVCHTDLTSQYPTVNSLLGNPAILAAEMLSFDDCTNEIRSLIEQITRKDCFVKENWRKWNVFCLVQADHDLVPVRAEYTEHSGAKNIGFNFFTAKEPVWLHLCDAINSKILNGEKVPKILKAIRVVPSEQKQDGLKAVKLRGEIEIDPRTDDIFKVMIEQKEIYKRAAKEKKKLAQQKRLDGHIAAAEALEAQALIDDSNSYFSKICANGTSYGMYFELTPQTLFAPVDVEVFSGDHRETLRVSKVERPGKFYFPIIAASITAAAHLMLGLIQACVEEKGGHFSHCDTDALVPVSTEKGGWVHCPDERGPNGEYGIKALSWKEVDEIVTEFEKLNPYDRKKVPGSILKIEDQNYDQNGSRVQLYAQCISAKRYAEWIYDKHDNIQLVECKAHALGVLAPPKEREDGDFIEEAWHEMLEGFGYAAPRGQPDWYSHIAKMRIVVSTPAVLGMLKGFVPPRNFVDMALALPMYEKKGALIQSPTLIMQFSKNGDPKFAFDARTGKKWKLYSGINTKGIRRRGEVWVKTYGNFLAEYRSHPEAKFVDHEGNPCSETTRGLLHPSHIIEDQRRYIGKETSRKWEQGEDLSIIDFECMEYRSKGKVVANAATIERIKSFGIRKLEKATGIHHDTLVLISKGRAVKPRTLRDVIQFLDTEEKKNETPKFSKQLISNGSILYAESDEFEESTNER